MWGDGDKFEGDLVVKTFTSKEEAQARLKADYEQARECLHNAGYDEEEIDAEIDEDGLRIMTDANELDDYWEGKIQVEEVTFNT